MRKAFTILELLIVIGIISMLVTLGVNIYSSVQKNSRDARRKADLEQIAAALELYRSNNNSYPSTLSMTAGCSNNGAISTYLTTIPEDPLCQIYKYYYTALPANCSEVSSPYCTNYTLASQLESTSSNCQAGNQLPINSCKNGGGTPNYNCNYCIGPYGKK